MGTLIMVVVGYRLRDEHTIGTREYKYSDELLVLIESFLLGAVDVNNNYAY